MIVAILFLVIAFCISPILGFSLLGILVVICIIAMFSGSEQAEKEKEAKKVAYEAAKVRAKIGEEKVAKMTSALTDKYGEPEKIINLNNWREYNTAKYIMIFAKASIVYLCDTEFPFKDIVSFKLIDNYQIKHGEVTGSHDTKTNTGSLVGRSIGGALIGGGVGAVIGASSASKNTTVNYSQENDTVIHNYTLVVCTTSFEKPTINIEIGKDWEKATEVEAVFNLIVNNQPKQ